MHLLRLVTATLSICCGNGAVFTGRIGSTETWKYVARYAFVPTETPDAVDIGVFHYKVRFLTESTTSLVMYYAGYDNFMDNAANGNASCAGMLREQVVLACNPGLRQCYCI
jgi:hypothetical protein